MQRSALVLLALTAPLPAAAFGDMDCIGVEVCQSNICAPTTTPFAITFDWADGSVGVDIASGVVQFDVTEQEDPSPTTLVYGGVLDDRPGLLLNAEDADSITAYLTVAADDASMIQYTGECSPRRAI